ncbi:MAG TPA: vWA domain-containing protein [Candidatus Saccharimonadales bacterium]
MTKENFTSINVIIDASGSMQHLAADTIGSFNSFLKEQKEGPGEAAFSLCTFSTDYRLQHDFVKIAGVPNLDSKAYAPSGGTALLDAMGTAIDSLGTKLSALPEEERPSKVIFLIITDGHENSSKHYKLPKIKAMVEHQKDTYNWEFVFMGANMDAITAGESMGVTASNSINYAATKGGTHKLYDSVSRSMTSYRASASSRNDNFFVDTNPKVDVTPVVPVTPPANDNRSK